MIADLRIMHRFRGAQSSNRQFRPFLRLAPSPLQMHHTLISSGAPEGSELAPFLWTRLMSW